jgi:hypothetical protein
MELKITGTVNQFLEEQSGESRNGPWRKQEFILETDGKYPKSVCLVMWGDNIDQFAVQVDERLTAHIDIASRRRCPPTSRSPSRRTRTTRTTACRSSGIPRDSLSA